MLNVKRVKLIHAVKPTENQVEPARRQGQAETCIFGDGVHSYEFQSGKSFGNLLDPGCSNTDNNDIFVDFPCFCNPNKYPNTVDCPFCSFETNQLLGDGVTHESVCARHDETIKFVAKDGQAQSCSCHIPLDGLTEPITICQPLETPGSCTLQLPDGTFRVFANGASLCDILPTRCTPVGGGGGSGSGVGSNSGNEYPCFCNVAVPGQIYCPYCRLLDYWRGAEEDPFLICVRNEETVLITDKTGIDNFQCTCSIHNNPLHGEATEKCVRITESPTLPPTERPRHPIIGGSTSEPMPSRSTSTPTPQPITKPPRSFSPSKPAATPMVPQPDSKDSATTTVKGTVGTLMSMVAVLELILL